MAASSARQQITGGSASANSSNNKICNETAENKRNAQRLYELNTRGTKVLCNYFHRVFPRDSKQLYQALMNHAPQIQKLKDKSVINNHQWDLIFPTGSQETFSNRFDPSLFRILISNFGKTGKPLKFWKSNKLPPQTDQSDEANALRIMICRNKIHHTTGFVETPYFKQIATVFIDAMVRLGESRQSFTNLLPPFHYQVFEPIPNFFARIKDLECINDIIKKNKEDKMRLVIHGMAGIGKSEIARHLVNKHKQSDINILWINSSDQTALETSFIDIAEKLELNIKDEAGKYKGVKFIVDAVHDHLRHQESIYVYDDANDIETVVPFLPKHQPSCSIITSQVTRWPQGFNIHELKPFVHDENELFIKANLTGNLLLSAKQISEVYQQLGGHPLAVQQFISSINNTMLTVEEYIDILKSHTATLLKSTKLSTLHGDKSVIGSIQITLRQLSEGEDSKLACEMINIISYFHGGDISFDVLKILFPQNEVIDIDLALKKLQSFSLIKIAKSNVTNEKSISVHSMIHKTIRFDHGSMNDADKYIRYCVAIFKNKLDVAESIYNHSNFAKEWYRDFLHFLSLNIEQNIVNDLVLFKSKAIIQMVINRGGIGSLTEIYQRSLEKCVHGTDHPDTLKSMNNLAYCYTENNQLKEAIELFQQTLEKQKNVLGTDHPDTLASMHNLAICYMKNNQVKAAIELFQQTLEKRKHVLGTDHPDTLASMNNLAICYMKNNQVKAATELFQQTLGKQKNVLGTNHPETLASMNNLAICYMKNNQLKEAIELHQKTLEKKKHVLGTDHHDTLTSMNNLAYCYMRNNQLKEAIELFQTTLEKQKNVLGTDHPDTLKPMNNLAMCYMENNQVEDAIPLFLEAYKISATKPSR